MLLGYAASWEGFLVCMGWLCQGRCGCVPQTSNNQTLSRYRLSSGHTFLVSPLSVRTWIHVHACRPNLSLCVGRRSCLSWTHSYGQVQRPSRRRAAWRASRARQTCSYRSVGGQEGRFLCDRHTYMVVSVLLHHVATRGRICVFTGKRGVGRNSALA